MKGILLTGAAVLIVGIGASAVLAQAPAPAPAPAPAQQPPPPPRPYYVGNPVGQPIAPPRPDAENPPAFVPMDDHVRMYGALYSVESCSYDPVMDLIVAPNRGVGQAVQTNNAWIALINHDGTVHTPRWIGIQNPGEQRDTQMTTPLILNEPLGSDIMNGILYLADRDGGTPDPANPGQNLPQTAVIAMFDMATGEPVDRWAFDAPAFNDIEVAEDGTIYATVSGAMGRIYKITPDGELSEFVPTPAEQGQPPNGPNGIAINPDGTIVTVGGGDTVFTWSTTGELLLTENASMAGNDGLVIMPDGTKFISSVQNGGVSMIRPGEASVLIAQGIPSAASMCYDAGAHQLVIPMNANNGLAFLPLEGIYEAP
ncbi:MAG: SMP-30/gluconolactonase/LRE family protein [Bauldia sp.]